MKAHEAISRAGQPQPGKAPYLQKVAKSARDRQILLKLDAAVSPEEVLAKAKECFELVRQGSLLHGVACC